MALRLPQPRRKGTGGRGVAWAAADSPAPSGRRRPRKGPGSPGWGWAKRTGPALGPFVRRWGFVALLGGALVLARLGLPGVAGGQTLPGTAALWGRVADREGTPLAGVLVRLLPPEGEAPLRTTETDPRGTYRWEGLSPGSYRVEASRLGFLGEVRPVRLEAGARLEVSFVLESRPVEVAGVLVEAERSRERARFENQAGLTVRELAPRQIKKIPGLAEADPLRAVEVLPGVITTSDFSSAYNVRGGSADQNLILLDGIPVFNPTHLGGIFSVFNADMVRRAELQSGGFPPRFGGRVSSVLDVESDPGDGRFGGEGGVSFLATRLSLGGGLGEGLESSLGLTRTAWRVSGRRSYFDQLMKPFFTFPYHLTDFQGVAEAWTRGGRRLTVTGYSGRDVLDLTTLSAEAFPLRVDWQWGNDVVGGKWTAPLGREGWWEVRGGYSRFRSGLRFPDFADTDIRSAIALLGVEGEVRFVPVEGVGVGVGGGTKTLRVDNLFETGGTVFRGGKGEGTERDVFVQGDWRQPGAWIVEGGIRLEEYRPSPGARLVEVSPRASAKRFLGGTRWAVKGAVGRYVQFLHSIRDEELPLGLDVWVLTGTRLPHVVSDQVQLGWEGYPREGWFASLEGYLRSFQGVVTTNLADDPNREEDDFLPGTGLSYGFDLFVSRSRGPTTGWLALSFLKATRTFPDFLAGLDPPPKVTYPPVFDRRLDLDLVLQREVKEGLELGLRWNFGTGLPYTRPLGSYPYLTPRLSPGAVLEWDPGEGGRDRGAYAVALGDRNGSRYPARHRLDLSVRWVVEKPWGTLVPYLHILNLYNRKNVLFYFYEYHREPPVRSGISMFPFLPSLGVEVKF